MDAPAAAARGKHPVIVALVIGVGEAFVADWRRERRMCTLSAEKKSSAREGKEGAVAGHVLAQLGSMPHVRQWKTVSWMSTREAEKKRG